MYLVNKTVSQNQVHDVLYRQQIRDFFTNSFNLFTIIHEIFNKAIRIFL